MSKEAVLKAVVWLLSLAMICYTITGVLTTDRFRIYGNGKNVFRIDTRTGRSWSWHDSVNAGDCWMLIPDVR